MNIVFLGTSEFSLDILSQIHNSNHKVLAVVTQPDKVSGRNKKIVFSPVKQFSLDNNIPLYQFNRISRDGEEILKSIGADMFITASYGQILRQNIIDIPPLGIVNFHASILPKYRGSTPIQSAIISGEKTTGITIMQTDIGIDTGDVFFDQSIDILDEDTADSMFVKLGKLGQKMAIEFLDNFDYYLKKKTPQNHDLATHCQRIKFEDTIINFDKKAEDVVNFIRGNCSVSTACFSINSNFVKVYSAKVIEFDCENISKGTIIECSPKKGIYIMCSDKAISLDVVQPSGKKQMKGRDWANGARLAIGSKVDE